MFLLRLPANSSGVRDVCASMLSSSHSLCGSRATWLALVALLLACRNFPNIEMPETRQTLCQLRGLRKQHGRTTIWLQPCTSVHTGFSDHSICLCSSSRGENEILGCGGCVNGLPHAMNFVEVCDHGRLCQTNKVPTPGDHMSMFFGCLQRPSCVAA